MEHHPQHNRSLEDLALAFTRWVGSIQSLLVHTVIFVLSFAVVLLNLITFDRMLLVLTTALSLEAIYLAIFIQMSLNLARESLAAVEQDVDEIQVDIDEIQEDVGDIQENVDEIQGDIDEIQENVDDMQEEIQEDIQGEDETRV